MNRDTDTPGNPAGIICDLESEQKILGSILANYRRYYEVRGWITPDQFADPIHGKIYAAMEAEIESNGDIRRLQIPDDELEEVGGTAYLDQLYTVYRRPALGAVGTAGQSIHRCWLRRCEQDC